MLVDESLPRFIIHSTNIVDHPTVPSRICNKVHTKGKGIQFCVQEEGSLGRKPDKHLNCMCYVCSTAENIIGVTEGDIEKRGTRLSLG